MVVCVAGEGDDDGGGAECVVCDDGVGSVGGLAAVLLQLVVAVGWGD